MAQEVTVLTFKMPLSNKTKRNLTNNGAQPLLMISD